MARIRKYGANLHERQAQKTDLPPGCVWIEAKSVASAYRQMFNAVVQGDACSAIWVPPSKKFFNLSRTFFEASAGRLPTNSWNFKHKSSSREALLKKTHEFFNKETSLLIDEKTYREGLMAGYYAASAEMEQWSEAIISQGTPKLLAFHLESERHYRAHPLSYKIHADGDVENFAGFRLLLSLAGDHPFLYDSSQLDLDDQGMDFLTFRPKTRDLTVWSPPSRAAVMVHYADSRKPYYAVHSAKGPKYAQEPKIRVLAKINAQFS